MRIIYQNDAGGVSIIIPAPNVRATLAQKAKLLGVSEEELLAEGWASGLTPSEFAASLTLTIEEIAAKDVPTGKPYKIVADTDIPTDRSARDAWTVDVADLTDGVGQ